MFLKNTRHLQIPLSSRVDERPFAALYADVPSRPNVPVNVLVGLEFLKATSGWTDEEMYNEFCYDVQMRYALGYLHLGEGYFDLRTLYDFREWLACHMQEKDALLAEHRVTLLQTARRGQLQDPEWLHLDDCRVQTDASRRLKQVTCPEGESAGVTSSPSGREFVVVFGELTPAASGVLVARWSSGNGRGSGFYGRDAGSEPSVLVPSGLGEWATPGGSSRSHGVRCQTPVWGRRGSGAGSLLRGLSGDGGWRPMVNVWRLHSFWQAGWRPPQGKEGPGLGWKRRPGRVEQPNGSLLFWATRAIQA
jgi:hypothetical protein